MKDSTQYHFSLFLREIERTMPPAMFSGLVRTFLPHKTPFRDSFHARRTIFVRIPKTASSSLEAALGIEGAGHVPITRYYAYDSVATTSYFKFCIARNPWDRLLSAFSHLQSSIRAPDGSIAIPETFPHANTRWAARYLAGYETFEEFVLALRRPEVRRAVLRYFHFSPQAGWICRRGENTPAVDYIGKFEELSSSFETIWGRLAHPGEMRPELPHLRASQHSGYREAYTGQMVAIVADIYDRDIKVLGYDFAPG